MPREQHGGSAGSVHVESLCGESMCTALGWSTIVIVRALFFSPNKLFLQIKNEKSFSSHSSFLHYSSSGTRGRDCAWMVGAERSCAPRDAGTAHGEVMGLPGGEAERRQGRSKHQSSLQGLSTKLADW